MFPIGKIFSITKFQIMWYKIVTSYKDFVVFQNNINYYKIYMTIIISFYPDTNVTTHLIELLRIVSDLSGVNLIVSIQK